MTVLIGGIIAAVSGAAGAFGKHLWNKFRKNPVAISADAAALALAMRAAADDRKLTASELKDLADAAEKLAAKFH